MHLDILWRSSLSSCNYGCTYCPFAKKKAALKERKQDERELQRFVSWVCSQTRSLSVFFTPWGEALTYRHYYQALVDLSCMSHVQKVAIQTNLSASLKFLDKVDPNKIQLWATYHPDWTTEERFCKQVETARGVGVELSVGVVGFPEFIDKAERLRAKLPEDVYLWVNAVKRLADQYSEEDLKRIEAIDPLFRANLYPHQSLGEECRTGESVISIDGDGNARRCHFVEDILGNIYQQDLQEMLAPRFCSKQQCRCHIGYVHMPKLKLSELFGWGRLARIPASFHHRFPEALRLPKEAISTTPDLLAPTLPPSQELESQRQREQWKRRY